MELLDRYVAAVKSSLPSAQRDDIAAEICAELEAQVEDREQQLGRPLTPDEAAEILKRYGHPRIVASRYCTTQYLIGPMLLPFYWNVLKIVLLATTLLAFAAASAKTIAFGAPAVQIAAAWGTFWTTMLAGVGAVTIIFAIIERTAQGSSGGSIWLERWNPRTLAPAAVYDRPRFSTLGATFELLFNIVALGWLIAGARSGHFIFGPIAFADILRTLLTPANIVVALYVVSIALFLIRPSLLGVRVIMRIIYNFFFVAACVVLFAAPVLVTIEGQPHKTALVALVLHISFGLAALISLWELYCDSRFFLKQRAFDARNSTAVAI